MFRWKEPAPETRESSNATPNAHLDQFRYSNRKARPVRSSRSRFDTAMIYVALFLAIVACVFSVGYHTIFG